HPVCVALDAAGDGTCFPLASGRPDDWFDHDGQITKRPVRALTLSALAPTPFEYLWDIGAGSGSVSIEWLLSHPTVTATAIEADPVRANRIVDNAKRLGADRLQVINDRAPECLIGLPAPNVVFIGGGLSDGPLDWITQNLAPGTRLVANAVTLESEALLTLTHAAMGGDLSRFEISQATPIGTRTGWKASYPITQWNHTL
ncbi:MAG: precorrin-6Y C5,15-methyltransferase (decarboxylating) subunit CbiT, partial [Pseudomonadota bacterium]